MENYKLTYRVIWSRHSKDNGYPIYFKLAVKGQKPKFEKTGFYIDNEGQWNDTTKKVVKRPDAQAINDALDKKRLEWKKEYLKDYLDDRNIRPSLKRKKITSLFEYIKAVKGDTNKTKTLISNIKEFQGYEPGINEINIEWCRLYEAFLREEKEYKDNSVNTDFKVLRRVTNQAKLEKHIKETIIGKGYYKMPKPGKTIPTFLVKEERLKLLAGIDDCELRKNKATYRALVYFLFSVYTGLRHSDLRRFDPNEHVIGDQLVMLASKTGEPIVYPLAENIVPPKILALIKELGHFKMTYKDYNDIYLKQIAKHFKLTKNLTSHVGRHSFGRLMAEYGVPESDCAWYMGDIGIAVVKIYYHISGKIRTERLKELNII